MLRVNLRTFALDLIIAVVILHFLARLIAGLLNIPGKIQHFSTARKGCQATTALNNVERAFSEGKFKQAGNETARVLTSEEAGGNRVLALILGAHATD